MDVFDIPIVTITEKYLQIIEEMKQMNLEVAGEFTRDGRDFGQHQE